MSDTDEDSALGFTGVRAKRGLMPAGTTRVTIRPPRDHEGLPFDGDTAPPEAFSGTKGAQRCWVPSLKAKQTSLVRPPQLTASFSPWDYTLASHSRGPSPTSSWPTHFQLSPMFSLPTWVIPGRSLADPWPCLLSTPHCLVSCPTGLLLGRSDSSDEKPRSLALCPARKRGCCHAGHNAPPGTGRPGVSSLRGTLGTISRCLEWKRGQAWGEEAAGRCSVAPRPSGETKTHFFVPQGLWYRHPLELPPDDALLEDGRLPGCWEHSGDQACPGGSGHVPGGAYGL